MKLNKTLVEKYSNDKVKTYLVDGKYIRDKLDMDFTQGGHDLVYDFIPHEEIWIDNANESEIAFIVLHELKEHNLMADGMKYEEAHEAANTIERNARDEPKKADEMIQQELTNMKSMPKAETKTETKLIRKSMPITVRKNSAGEDEICITTPNYDRGNDRVEPRGAILDNYNKNPIIMWLHDYHGQTASAGIPVGKNSYLKVTDEGIVAGPPIFLEGDPFADRVKNAWNQGILRTASIGFAPIEYETNEKGGTDYKKWEMLEWSFAPVPMNAEALRIAKNMTPEELKDIIAEAEIVDSTEDKKEKKPISQAEIKDEIDYLCLMIEEVGLSEETKKELRRLSGNDIPVAPVDKGMELIKKILGK